MPQDSSPTSTCPPGPTASTNGSSDVMVNFDPDPADLALSSVPGQEAFDPRRHRFSDEELKPQPMIKKARKMLVPNEQKVLHLTQFYTPPPHFILKLAHLTFNTLLSCLDVKGVAQKYYRSTERLVMIVNQQICLH